MLFIISFLAQKTEYMKAKEKQTIKKQKWDTLLVWTPFLLPHTPHIMHFMIAINFLYGSIVNKTALCQTTSEPTFSLR